MENDIYNLLGYNNGSKVPKKSASSARLDNFGDRGSVSSAKNNTLKIKLKSKELQEMRSIPVINQKSRKIAENMKRERMDLIAKYENKQTLIVEPPPPEPVRISVNIMRTLELVEPPPKEPDLKSMNIHERAKYLQEKKEKKLEEQRKVKKDQELQGCTFKPQKPDIQDFVIAPKEETNRRASTGARPDKPSKPKNSEKQAEEQSLAFLLKGVESDKNKAAPSTQTIKPKAGFLSALSNPSKK